MDTFLAVDIGGTRLRVASYPQEGIQAIKQNRVPTRSSTAAVIDRLIEQLALLWPDDGRVCAIAVAAPGAIDPEKGIIYSAPNIPGWENLHLRRILEDRFQVPVRLGNDANMAALGEWKYGAGRGHKDLIYFTVSTGIGGGVISANCLLLGSSGLAAEVGHVTIDPNGPMCGCGQRGHLEAFASGTAIARYVAAELADGVPSSMAASPAPSTMEIAAAAREGDALAIAAFNRAGRYLALGVANYLHLFNPSIIIFGGGVSRAGSLIFDPMRAALKELVISPAYLDQLEIVPAALGDDAGLLGALALARQE